MKTLPNGNIFRVTGHLCGEFTDHRWIPRTKASDAGALMFSLIYAWINCWVNNRVAGDLRRYRAHYDVTVMCFRSMDYIQLKHCSQLEVTEDCKQSIGTRKVLSTVTVGLNKTCHGLSLNVWNISCKIIVSYLYVTTKKWEHRVM